MTTFSIFLVSSFPTTVNIFLPIQHPLFNIYESNSILFYLSSLFSFFSSLFLSLSFLCLSLPLSLSILFLFTDWVLKVTRDWDLRESSLRYLFHITSLALSYFTCKIFFSWNSDFSTGLKNRKAKMTFVFIKKYIYG